MMPTWVKGLVLASSVLTMAGFAGGCSGGDDDAPTTRRNVSVEPGRFCFAVAERRELAQHPPRLAYSLRNADVDNFSGRSEEECNVRQLVYRAPQAPLPGSDRLQLFVKVQFLRQRSPDLDSLSPPPDDRFRLPSGRPAYLYREPGRVAARFVIGPALFDATLGCVPPDAEIRLVACRHPALDGRELTARVRPLVASFDTQAGRRLR